MPTYNYKAITDSGNVVRGKFIASNEFDLEKRLQENFKLELIDCSVSKNITEYIFRDKVNAQDLIILCIQIEQLDKVGVPLLDALLDLRDVSTKPAIKSLISTLCDSLNAGKMLSEAMADHPQVFDEVFVGLVKAGEKTGNLSVIFGYLSEHLKWTMSMQEKLSKATRYPMVMGLMMIVVIGVMMLYVIPQLTSFLLSQGFDLPLSTKFLIGTSKFVQSYWIFIIVSSILSVVGTKILARSVYYVAYQLDAFKLLIPTVGDVIRKIEISRFCRFFAITFSSGIGILECMNTALGTLSNKAIKSHIEEAVQEMESGTSLTEALKYSHQFPNLVIRMIHIGENSGDLSSSLREVNLFYDHEVEESIERMISAIQPTMTVVIGLIILWIAMAVFGPLYDNLNNLDI